MTRETTGYRLLVAVLLLGLVVMGISRAIDHGKLRRFAAIERELDHTKHIVDRLGESLADAEERLREGARFVEGLRATGAEIAESTGLTTGHLVDLGRGFDLVQVLLCQLGVFDREPEFGDICPEEAGPA